MQASVIVLERRFRFRAATALVEKDTSLYTRPQEARLHLLSRPSNGCQPISAALYSPGQILISESTREAVGDAFEIGGQMSVEAKGVERPIRIYEVCVENPSDSRLIV